MNCVGVQIKLSGGGLASEGDVARALRLSQHR